MRDRSGGSVVAPLLASWASFAVSALHSVGRSERLARLPMPIRHAPAAVVECPSVVAGAADLDMVRPDPPQTWAD
jgi:hypothetical protein